MNIFTPAPPSPDRSIANFLARSSTILLFVMAVLVTMLLAVQMWFDEKHEPNAALTALLGGIVGAISQNYGQSFNYEFGTTAQNRAKDVTIQTQANTIATASTALTSSKEPLEVEVKEMPPAMKEEK